MAALSTILMCFAFIFALFAAFRWPPSARVDLGWLAFTFFVAAILLGGPIQALLLR